MLCSTYEGWRFNLRADCQYGHERVAMYQDHMRKLFVCGVCEKTISPNAILMKVPDEYRPSGNPLLGTLQALLDYEIVGVITESGDLFIEYPKLKVK